MKASRDAPKWRSKIGGPLMSRRIEESGCSTDEKRERPRGVGSARSIQSSSQLSAKWPRYGPAGRERNRGGPSRMVLKPDRMRRNSRGRFCASWIFALERSSVAQLCYEYIGTFEREVARVETRSSRAWLVTTGEIHHQTR